jgi:hypothetical protein
VSCRARGLRHGPGSGVFCLLRGGSQPSLPTVLDTTHVSHHHASLLPQQWQPARRGVLLSGGFAPLQAAHSALPPDAATTLALYTHQVAAHDALLAKAGVVLHHGGSGTVAAALAAGTPQVVAPLHFDQPFWAGRLEAMGVAPPAFDWGGLAPGKGTGGSSGSGGSSAAATGSGSVHSECEGGAVAGSLQAAVAAAAAALAGGLHHAAEPAVRRRCKEVAAALQVKERGVLLGVASRGANALVSRDAPNPSFKSSPHGWLAKPSQEPHECGIDTAVATLLTLL